MYLKDYFDSSERVFLPAGQNLRFNKNLIVILCLLLGLMANGFNYAFLLD